MRPIQNLVIVGMLGVALMGARWIVRAQDTRSPWGPPPILPPEATPRTLAPSKSMDTKKGTFVSYPRTAQPLTTKSKDKPRTVAQRDSVDAPRAVSGMEFEENEPLRQIGGQAAAQTPTTEPLFLPKPPALPVIPTPELVGLPTIVPKGLTNPMLAPAPPPVATFDRAAAPIVSPTPPMLESKATPMKGVHDVLKIPAPMEEAPKRGLTAPKAIPAVTPALPVAEIKPPATTVTPRPLEAAEPSPVPPTVSVTVPLTIPEPKRASDVPKAFERIRPARSQPLVAQTIPVATGDLVPFKEPKPSVTPPGNVPSGMLVQLQTPALIVEKRGMATLRPGETADYYLVVRNLSLVPAHLVRIVDEIPADATVVAADPTPEIQGGRATWLLPNVPAQTELTLRLTLRVGSATGFAHHTSVLVSAANSAKPASVTVPHAHAPPDNPSNLALRASQAEPLSIRLVSPPSVAVGKPVDFDIQITNVSNQPCVGLDLFGYLPEGLTTPQGPNIKGAFEGTLKPGESKTLRMPATAVKPGRYTVEVRIVTRAGHETGSTATITIDADTLQIQQALIGRLNIGRDAEYRIEVANPTGRLLRNVNIFNQLPDGLEFVSASDHGLYQANRRGVYWVIDQLPAGRSHIVTMRLYGTKPGAHQHLVIAKADGSPEVRSAGVIPVEGVAGLSIKVLERDNPVELGRETVYEIQVANPGTTPTTNVKLQVQFPPGLTPRNAQGNTRHLVDRQTIAFDPLPTLGPQGQAIFRVSAVANQAGEQRVRFAVVSDQTQTPIVREQGTKVYRD